jgi:hypothetical protein
MLPNSPAEEPPTPLRHYVKQVKGLLFCFCSPGNAPQIPRGFAFILLSPWLISLAGAQGPPLLVLLLTQADLVIALGPMCPTLGQARLIYSENDKPKRPVPHAPFYSVGTLAFVRNDSTVDLLFHQEHK